MFKCSCEVGFGCLCTIPLCLLAQGFPVDFVVLSLCTACTEHIWNLTVQTVSGVQRSVISVVECWSSDKSSRVWKTSRVSFIASHQQVSSTHLIRHTYSKW